MQRTARTAVHCEKALKIVKFGCPVFEIGGVLAQWWGVGLAIKRSRVRSPVSGAAA